MRFTIAIAMLAMLASSVCAQSGSVSAPAVEAPAFGGDVISGASSVISGDIGGSSTRSFGGGGEVIQSGEIYGGSAPIVSSGQVYSAPAASSDCGCGGGAAAPIVSAPIVSAPVQSFAPAASPCGCNACPPAPPADPCCPQQRRGFFRSLFGG